MCYLHIFTSELLHLCKVPSVPLSPPNGVTMISEHYTNTAQVTSSQHSSHKSSFCASSFNRDIGLAVPEGAPFRDLGP